MIELILMRHGYAEAAAPGQADAQRVLSEKGRARIRRQARTLARLDLPVQQVFSSPLLRAVQTAEGVVRATGWPLVVAQELRPGAEVDDLKVLAEAHRIDRGALVVGHQPDLGRMVHFLTRCQVPVHPGTMAVVEVRSWRSGGGVLAGLYDGEVFARLGKGRRA